MAGAPPASQSPRLEVGGQPGAVSGPEGGGPRSTWGRGYRCLNRGLYYPLAQLEEPVGASVPAVCNTCLERSHLR